MNTIRYYVSSKTYGSLANNEECGHPHRSRETAFKCLGRRLKCEQCKRQQGEVGPSHDPSPYCESGKRPHCTCDTCF